jgi:hypothetical protein
MVTHLAIPGLEAIHDVSKVDAKVNLRRHPAAADCALQRHQGIAVVARHTMKRGAVWDVCILHVTAGAGQEQSLEYGTWPCKLLLLLVLLLVLLLAGETAGVLKPSSAQWR